MIKYDNLTSKRSNTYKLKQQEQHTTPQGSHNPYVAVRVISIQSLRD